MADQMLKCVDCGCQFEFTQAEQEWFNEKKFSAPKRCKMCRKKRKEQKDQSAPARSR